MGKILSIIGSSLLKKVSTYLQQVRNMTVEFSITGCKEGYLSEGIIKIQYLRALLISCLFFWTSVNINWQKIVSLHSEFKVGTHKKLS